jgi:hypothetical protein
MSSQYATRFQVDNLYTGETVAKGLTDAEADALALKCVRETGQDHEINERRLYPAGLRTHQTLRAANYR